MTLPRVQIDRARPTDLTVLVPDHGQVPMNIGAILVFDQSSTTNLGAVRAVLTERIPRVPRLRQRLQRVPFGCGRPIWIDDPEFSIDRHLTARRWPAPGDARQLLDIAAELVCGPLNPDRP